MDDNAGADIQTRQAPLQMRKMQGVKKKPLPVEDVDHIIPLNEGGAERWQSAITEHGVPQGEVRPRSSSARRGPVRYLVDAVTEPGYLVPAAGKAWPATYNRINALMVDYTVGHGSTFAALPAAAQAYILARLEQQFDPSTSEFKATARTDYFDGLLRRLKVEVYV